ncbi:MAG TPA: hypothetical protein VK775_07290 [Chthoniobacterales bacterium]|jgi:hypothetical protein|nr:hypothetical protein [Chthoniobacterales bacterium]
MLNPQLKASDIVRLLSKNPTLSAELLKIASPWLLPPEAAAYMKRSTGWLAQRRFHSDGPPVHLDSGKVMYFIPELDEYMRSCDRKRKATGPNAGRPRKDSAKQQRKAVRS